MKKAKLKADPFALAKMAEKALKEAVYDTFKDHARTGGFVAIWENGKVVKIPANKLNLKEPPAHYHGKKRSKKDNP